jgi:hypothetical protein
MSGISSSPRWELNAVVKRLQKRTASGSPVSAQVFVADKVPVSEVPAAAKKIVADACYSLKLAPDQIRIGKVRGLAKSFSVTSDVADVFAAIAEQHDVKTMLEAEQVDILPYPVHQKAVL